MERDPEVRIAGRGDDVPRGERLDERVRIGRDDADQRAVLVLAARRSNRRAEFVEAGEEAVDEAAHVRLDGWNTRLRDQLHPRDAGVERRHGRRPAVEAAGARVRRVVGDGHGEDVLVGEPACLRRHERLAQRPSKPHEAEPCRAQQVLHGSGSDDVGAEGSDVELERTDRLVAVREEGRSRGVRELGDRRDVVAVARAERHGRAADERRPLVDRVGEALERDAAVVLRPDVDDLGAAKLLRVRDLTDRRELVLADDDPVPLAREIERRDEPAHPLRDGGRDRDVVGLGMDETGEGGSRGLVPLDPEIPLGAVLVPARDPALDCGAHAGRERPLRAGVRVDRVLEDRELVPDCRPDAHRPRYALRSSSCWISSEAFPSSTTRPVDRT